MFNATLVNGNTYILAGVKYQNGKAVLVDESVKAHLEKYAVDTVILPGTGQIVTVPKFEFSSAGAKSAPVTTPAPAAPVAPAEDEADDSAPAAVMASGRPKAR